MLPFIFIYIGNLEVFLERQFHRRTWNIISLGSFYLEYYVDAIKEGDGQMVLRCWKYPLPIFKSSGRTNYSIEIMNICYVSVNSSFPPRQSAKLLYNHFVNVHGLPGMNIPADLHQEHLYRVCKDALLDWVQIRLKNQLDE